MMQTFEIEGHRLKLLRNGAEYFPELIAAIDAATQSVYLETYIYAADETGRQVSDALKRAARRGVGCYVMMDGFGSAALPQNWVASLRKAGVDVLHYRPESARWKMRRHRLRRMHRKLVLVDERLAFVGGINIADDLTGHPNADAPRMDYAVRVEGDVVRQIHASMGRLWNLVSWSSLRRRRTPRLRQKPQEAEHSAPVTLLVRDNVRHRRDIEHAYRMAINLAQQEILIANAYFLPGRRFRQTLLRAAQRGVRVTLLLQGQVEYRIQHYATLALYDELLRAGVEIYEYRASYLHAKVAVIDGQWATVGSSNIDPFSLWLAREANLVVHDAGFASSLRADLFDQMSRNAVRVHQAEWRRHGVAMRLVMRLSYAFMRLLTGLVGQARGDDDV
jgi:cardiolipin synthase